MSHQLGLDSVYEKLVLLEHFAFGSQQYCSARLIGSEDDQGDGELDKYWGWLKGIVSSYLIECAVRVRMLQDTVRGEDATQLARLDKQAASNLTIGTIVEGDFRLSLRETCNKIIHAQKAVPEWRLTVNGGTQYKSWSGDYSLLGAKGARDWELRLHVAPWAHAMSQFLDAAESAELTHYVGQDWY